MTKKVWIIAIFITAIVIVVIFNSTLLPRGLALPAGRLQAPLSSPVPEVNNYNPPVEVKYDKNTDLKKELESINPQVLDSDFETE